MKAIIFFVRSGQVQDEVLFQEFIELAKAAHIQVVGHLNQRQRKEKFLLGSGKIQEIKDRVEKTKANLVLMNVHLSPVHSRNLKNALGVPLMERTQLILKIFSQRAKSYEGQLQVELAQYLDELPRVRGAWLGSLSRQGGRVGGRGPGEKALETDRRQIQKQIRILRKKLLTLRKNRFQQRKLRQRRNICNFALIGYTNSGKSTLLNRLSGSKVPSQEHVFLTLDPVTRKIFVPGLPHSVLTDTVGFIQQIPPHLIEAFKATLEESAFADVLLHVIDLSSPYVHEQVKVVDSLIHELKWENKPCISVYNKIDQAPLKQTLHVQTGPYRCLVSAQSGEGIDHLLCEMKKAYLSLSQKISLFFPKNEEYKIYTLSKEAHIYKTEQGRGGTLCLTQLSQKQIVNWQPFIIK